MFHMRCPKIATNGGGMRSAGFKALTCRDTESLIK